MKKRWSVVFAICASLLFFQTTFAASSPLLPSGDPVQPGIYEKILSMKVKDFQRLKGRKLSLKEKIGFGVMKHRLKKHRAETSTGGQVALLFGIVAAVFLVAGLFLPYLIIASIASSIVAIVVGSSAHKRDPSDRKASAGKLLGWLSLGLALFLITLAVLVVAAIFD